MTNISCNKQNELNVELKTSSMEFSQENKTTLQPKNSILSKLSLDRIEFLVISFFIISLFIWFMFDHAIPEQDPCSHALFSANVRNFLTHPFNWSFEKLVLLVKQHFNYPPGGWFINGGLKLFFGDSIFADRICLISHFTILAICFNKLAKNLLETRVKTLASLIILLSTPLIAALSHVPLLDLLHTALFAVFLCCLCKWYKQSSWINALVAGLSLGVYVISKQIAVLYSLPILGVLGLSLLFKNKEKEQLIKITQLISFSVLGLSFLLIWVIPNYADLVSYCQNRGSLATDFSEKINLILRNYSIAGKQIFQSVNPLWLFATLPIFISLAFSGNFVMTIKQAIQRIWIPLLAALLGVFSMLGLAYYNVPEARYFGPVMLPFSLFFGYIVGSCLEQKQNILSRFYASFVLCLAPAMMLFLSFQNAPYVNFPLPLGVSSYFNYCGLTEDLFLRRHLASCRIKDAWKQNWVVDQISSTEKDRYVTLNILPNTFDLNQCAIAYLAHAKRAHITPVSWRGCNPDVTDNFHYNLHDFNSMDWFLIKTGKHGADMPKKEDKSRYKQALNIIQNSGDFELKAKTTLPDNSELLLYRKDYVKLWFKNSKNNIK